MRGLVVVAVVAVVLVSGAPASLAQPDPSSAVPTTTTPPPVTTTPPPVTTTPPPVTTTTTAPPTTTPPPVVTTTTTSPTTTTPPSNGTGTTTTPPTSSTTTAPLPTPTVPGVPAVPNTTEMTKYLEASQAAARANQDALTAQQNLTDKREAADKATTAASNSRQAADDAVKAEEAAKTIEIRAHAQAITLQAEVDSLVEITFKGLRLNGLAAVFSSDSPEEYLDAAMIMDVYAERHGEMVRTAQQAADDALDAQKKAKEARDQVEATSKKAEEDRVTAQRLADEAAAAVTLAEQRKTSLDGKSGDVKQALGVLSPADLARLTNTGPSINVPLPTGAAGDAVKFAMAQLGKPYVWGAVGPDTYDCSGLMQTAYKSVGVSIPRTTYVQALAGNAVPRDQVKAGDLILYYADLGHVAMAIDGTYAVHAPTAGEPVKVSLINAIGPIATIRRVTG
ncbi:NlpC/P60 family protein [Umezawaea sp. Da 62-37]|uniref:C40 family peptidase n=1 Tax=Umezawaea sp. Da 62-37 TaxID=3075927 RepID=UPI0028F74499|nr:NlpC/P60 family protein [Umezawaea sp. Da 62-37]WNV88870.1 NlpC/P60 family protein [Umezawaea sp. Da 62-37]